MSFKQVKELRKDGKLEEAYQLAKLDLEAAAQGGFKIGEALVAFDDPSVAKSSHSLTMDSIENNPAEKSPLPDIFKNVQPVKPNAESILWAKRALSWVLYDHLKLNATAPQFDTFIKYLQELADLQLPDDEKMVFDNVAWQAGKILFDIHRQEKVDFQKVNAIFELVKTFHFTKPSEAYSFLYKAFHKNHQEWSRYLECADWWGFENFRPEDFLKEEMPNGKPVMSIVEQAYIAYSKKLLEGEPSEADPFRSHLNRDKVNTFMPALDKVIELHPEYLYPPYFKAKLLLAMGSGDNALDAFLPFAKAKRTEFWVWDVLSDIFPTDPQKQMACLCKALTCRTSDEFLIKVRTKLAGLLISSEQYPEARTEIEHILATAQQMGWNTPARVNGWTNATWYKETKALPDNHQLYASFTAEAEEILFADIPTEVAVVEFVNSDKKILNFVVNKAKYGFLIYDQFLRRVEIGDCIEVRLDSRSKEGLFKALTLKKTNKEPDATVLRSFTSILTIQPDRDFGFADDIFIGSHFTKKLKLSNGDAVFGKAVVSFNPKRNEWGWKAVEVRKI
ncbi:MAG: hypothetical protein H6577_12760 [Lewinellaceae bacterium]|nr:hypothetical protein [Saprospiraceae bacterium]MCB9338993.1 hypothetical protein [Lewinellaceae bacterium]